TFNDHEGSTKSYAYTREHQIEVIQADFVMPREEITTQYDPGLGHRVMMHDGSSITLRKVAEDYDPTDRDKAYAMIRDHQRAGEVATGLLFVQEESRDMHEQLGTIPESLTRVPYETLCPGSAELEKLQKRFR